MDNKNFWRLVDWIRWHHMWYEPTVGTKQLLRTSRSLMKEYRRRKSYYGDTWEVFNDFLKQCVDPYMRNIKEEAYGPHDNLRQA